MTFFSFLWQFSAKNKGRIRSLVVESLRNTVVFLPRCRHRIIIWKLDPQSFYAEQDPPFSSVRINILPFQQRVSGSSGFLHADPDSAPSFQHKPQNKQVIVIFSKLSLFDAAANPWLYFFKNRLEKIKSIGTVPYIFP